MKAVHFGAGNIGRGFIGPLLIDSGYKVTFVEVDDGLVELLNSYCEYPVFILGKRTKKKTVRGFCAVSAHDKDGVIKAISNADIVTTSVGVANLDKVAPFIAQGLSGRKANTLVVACENANPNTSHLKNLIKQNIPESEWRCIEKNVRFPDCVVDRIVPNLPKFKEIHPLAVAVEEYAQLILEKMALHGDLPTLNFKGVEWTDNISAKLEEKLYCFNAPHAMVAYLGYIAGYKYIHEAFRDSFIQAFFYGVASETSALILRKHGIDQATHFEYLTKVKERFSNARLKDEVVRVGRNPIRKACELFIRPAREAIKYNIIPLCLSMGIAAAINYDNEADEEAQELKRILGMTLDDGAVLERFGLKPDELVTKLSRDNVFLFFILEELRKRGCRKR